MNSLSTSRSSHHSQPSQNPSFIKRINSHINTTTTLPLSNTHNIPPNSNINYQTMPCSTLPLSTVSNPTNINSLASISEPIKPFDAPDHK